MAIVRDLLPFGRPLLKTSKVNQMIGIQNNSPMSEWSLLFISKKKRIIFSENFYSDWQPHVRVAAINCAEQSCDRYQVSLEKTTPPDKIRIKIIV